MEQRWVLVDDHPGLRAQALAQCEAHGLWAAPSAAQVSLVFSRQASDHGSLVTDVPGRGVIRQKGLSAAAIEVFLGA
jgi:hypothetical protein